MVNLTITCYHINTIDSRFTILTSHNHKYMGYEMPAVRPKGPLEKPPREYRDPSEFKGAEKRTTLKAIREAANPLVQEWEQEREAHKEKLKKWAKDLLGLSPRAVAQKLDGQFDAAEAAGGDKDFMSDVSEVLHGMRKLKTRDSEFVKDVIAGIETFLADQTVVVSPEAKATHKKLKTEERAREDAASYVREMPAFVNPNAVTQPDLRAITPQDQEWFDKGDRGEIEDDDNLGGGMVGRLAGRH